MFKDFVEYGEYKKKVLKIKKIDRDDFLGVVLTNITKSFEESFLYFEVWEKIFDEVMYEGFSSEYLNLFFVCRCLSNHPNNTILDLVIELKKLNSKCEGFLNEIIENTIYTTKDLADYHKLYYTNKDRERKTLNTFLTIKKSLPDYSLIETLKSFGKGLSLEGVNNNVDFSLEGYYNNIESS